MLSLYGTLFRVVRCLARVPTTPQPATLEETKEKATTVNFPLLQRAGPMAELWGHARPKGAETLTEGLVLSVVGGFVERPLA